MKKLRYLCVQPATVYYAWQVEVMINNFISNGINPNQIDILVAKVSSDILYREKNEEYWNKLVAKYDNVNFYFYDDNRVKPVYYISSIRPNLLKQHFKKYPELTNEVFFYHDCDICFTKPFNFNHLLEDDVWYVSDTNSYINYDYINSKGYGIYEKMCEIVGIDTKIPKQNNSDSGGAQYILKGLTAEFWEKVETDCEKLYVEIKKIIRSIKKENPTHHELQIWCADMWAVLWNAWKFGNQTKIVSEMNFVWATDSISRWNEYNIYHNAGVVNSGELFYKSAYTKTLPYDIKLEDYSKDRCSYKYVEEILKTKKISCLL